MIKFFRKIRQNLLMENKTGKYFKYAIGEIVLVVIGILIALQINSWKNDVNTHKLELSTLGEFKKALIQDTLAINDYLVHLEQKSIGTRNLIEHLDSQKPYNATLDTLFMKAYTQNGYKSFNKSAFDLLKERGLDIISNEDLRRKISYHYDIDLGELLSWFERLERVNIAQTPFIYPLFTVNFLDRDKLIAGWHPNNYDELINNLELIAPFKHYELQTLSYIRRLKGFKQKTVTLLDLVNSEIADE